MKYLRINTARSARRFQPPSNDGWGATVPIPQSLLTLPTGHDTVQELLDAAKRQDRELW